MFKFSAVDGHLGFLCRGGGITNRAAISVCVFVPTNGLPWWLRRSSICLQCGRPGLQSLGREDLLEKAMAAQSSIFAWKLPWTEEPGGLPSMGLQRGQHDWATSLLLSFFHEQNAFSLKPTRFFNSINFYQIHVKSQNLQHTALMIPWRCSPPPSLIIPVLKCQPSKLFNNSYKALVQIRQVNTLHPFKCTYCHATEHYHASGLPWVCQPCP